MSFSVEDSLPLVSSAEKGVVARDVNGELKPDGNVEVDPGVEAERNEDVGLVVGGVPKEKPTSVEIPPVLDFAGVVEGAVIAGVIPLTLGLPKSPNVVGFESLAPPEGLAGVTLNNGAVLPPNLIGLSCLNV